MLEPETIKVIRKKLGLTQSELAKFMGMGGNRRIREWESGEYAPNATAKIVLEYCLENPTTDPFIQSRLNAANQK